MAQDSNTELLKIPVDKFKSYENCCVLQNNYQRVLSDPIENELRIYGYQNESNVLAYKSGKIAKIIKDNIGNSVTILLRSGDLIFVYKNVNNVKVKENDLVIENQILGQIATTTSENYLRFEIWEKVDKLNPIKFLTENP